MWLGFKNAIPCLNRVYKAASAALQRSLGDVLLERLDNGFLEAMFLGQAAGADEHVEQNLFHSFLKRFFWARNLKKLRRVALLIPDFPHIFIVIDLDNVNCPGSP